MYDSAYWFLITVVYLVSYVFLEMFDYIYIKCIRIYANTVFHVYTLILSQFINKLFPWAGLYRNCCKLVADELSTDWVTKLWLS